MPCAICQNSSLHVWFQVKAWMWIWSVCFIRRDFMCKRWGIWLISQEVFGTERWATSWQILSFCNKPNLESTRRIFRRVKSPLRSRWWSNAWQIIWFKMTQKYIAIESRSPTLANMSKWESNTKKSPRNAENFVLVFYSLRSLQFEQDTNRQSKSNIIISQH